MEQRVGTTYKRKEKVVQKILQKNGVEVKEEYKRINRLVKREVVKEKNES